MHDSMGANMIELPKRLMVASMSYSIVEASTELAHSGRYAETSYSHLVIKVALEYPFPVVQQALVHEIVHTVERHYLGVDLKESQIVQLAYGLFQVLRENPDVVAFILAKEDA